MLYLPFGITAGYAGVTLAYLLHASGVSVAAVAGLGALGIFPNTWKVLWAPLVDLTLTAKGWFVISVVVTAGTVLAMGLLPLGQAMLPWISVLIVMMSIAVTVSAMAADRFMAFDTAPEEKGRAAGWSQAGNLGGAGLGGGGGLWIAQHSGLPWIASVTLAAATLASAGALPFLTEPGRLARGRRMADVAAEAVRDVRSLITTRIGLLGCFILVLPLGTGAAQNLFAAVAGDWRAGPDEVALVVGALSGVFCIIGAIAGGTLCDRMDRKAAYLLFGLVLAVGTGAMAAAPRTPLTFVALASFYNLITGFCYAAYSAVVLEAIGTGVAATKFNLMSSISNVPIMLVGLTEGWAQTRWGSGAMLTTEAALGVAAIALYMVVALATGSWAGLRLARPASPARP